MRLWAAVALVLVGCGGDDGGPEESSGPVETTELGMACESGADCEALRELCVTKYGPQGYTEICDELQCSPTGHCGLVCTTPSHSGLCFQLGSSCPSSGPPFQRCGG